VDPSPPGWHGTAVIGVMGSLDDGIGTTGGVPDAEYLFIGTYNGSWYDIEGAILLAADTLEAGDVVLIEQQIGGPRTTGNGQEGYVSVSWWPWAFVAIEIAVGNGICVVEAAGNGSQNLSHPAYTTGNWGHHPYVPENDHLGITVGASGSAWDRDRIRASFSNYGPTVDLHGWGWDVLAPGYGDAYSEPGWRYTWFSGTSSATPVVANAVAAIQSIHKAVRGVPMDPVELRDVLIATGSPQLSENGQHIGPRPDAEAALWAIFGAEDCDGNGRPDEIDFAAGGDANGNGTLDACEPPCPADFDGSGTADIGDLLAFLGAFRLGRGDFDGNGSSDVNDLLAFLGAFRAGC
jgi:serine protease